MAGQYYPIWLRLKKDRKVTIVVPNELVKRVIKAVIKEKYNDLSFKFTNVYDCYRLTNSQVKSILPASTEITFVLVAKFDIIGIEKGS